MTVGSCRRNWASLAAAAVKRSGSFWYWPAMNSNMFGGCALGALARLGSPMVEELALEAWHRPDEHQEWARMMALECLHSLGSPHLQPLLAEAERDERQYLRSYAERLRRGGSAD